MSHHHRPQRVPGFEGIRPVEAPGYSWTPGMDPKGCSQVSRRVARGPGAHSLDVRHARPRETDSPRSPERPGAVTFQPPDSGRAGREREAAPAPASAPEAAPGSARPGRSRHVTGATRSRVARAPATRPPWGTRTRRRAARWSCGSRKVGRRRPAAAGPGDGCPG